MKQFITEKKFIIGKNLEGRIGEKGRKKGSSKKEGKNPYSVFLFNIGPYDRQKTEENLKKVQEGVGNFSG